ncbi:hypothetical protein ACJVC5_07890 [Peredibacter sp. HCB2-198]|uniref:hypothetical protein n=1 Tax=Peredibacter sp. HCB2-198 TaxID=3383025 RepID=UPI0038B4F014
MESFGKLHQQLLELHKTLLQYQGRIMEVKLEKHLGPYDLWHLSLNDENFVWLRKISEIIVEMDELNEAKDKDPQIFTKIRGDLKNLFFPLEKGSSDFDTRLTEALEKDPHICLQMGKLKGLLG